MNKMADFGKWGVFELHSVYAKDKRLGGYQQGVCLLPVQFCVLIRT